MQNTIDCPFIFLPNGTTVPADWANAHPDLVILPAQLQPAAATPSQPAPAVPGPMKAPSRA